MHDRITDIIIVVLAILMWLVIGMAVANMRPQ